VGLNLSQIGEFVFVLLSAANSQGLLADNVYLLLMGEWWWRAGQAGGEAVMGCCARAGKAGMRANSVGKQLPPLRLLSCASSLT